MQIDLKGRVALVTGGSRGIGRATALLFAESGAKVAIGYRNDEASASTAVEAMRAAGTEAFAIRADVSTAEGCAALHAEAVQRVGPIDVLVNNAGHHENDVFLALDDASFSRLFDAHVLSVVRLSRLVAPSMMARKWGRILNLSSVAATKPTVGQVNYAAAKAAVEAVTKSLAIEFHKRGVNVNAVAPGLIATDMMKDADTAFVLAHQLVRRLGRPEEIASWLLMLASRHGDYVTGRIFELDGGFMLI